MTKTAPKDATKDVKQDLDALIREAEQRVVAADRDWRRHNEELSVAVRGQAGRAARWGGIGLGAAVLGVAAMGVRWRLTAKTRARRNLISKALDKLPWPQPKRPPPSPPGVPAAVARSPRWHAAVATIGTLLGAATRSGLKLPAKGGGLLSLLVGAGLPLVTRWLRGREQPPR